MEGTFKRNNSELKQFTVKLNDGSYETPLVLHDVSHGGRYHCLHNEEMEHVYLYYSLTMLLLPESFGSYEITRRKTTVSFRVTSKIKVITRRKIISQ